jgi:hypothetical protein
MNPTTTKQNQSLTTGRHAWIVPPTMNTRIPIIGADDLPTILDASEMAVIHLDADWDGCRFAMAHRMEELIDSHPDVFFGYVDIHRDPDHARAIHLLNVPACSYYRRRTLVATVIGIQQDISSNLAILRSGGTLETTNRISPA